MALGLALFLVAFGLLHVGPFDGYEIVDTPVYQGYGDTVVDFGGVPYRDFSIEYPPGALPAFIVPSLAPAGDYRTVFEIEMLVCGLAAVALLLVTLAACGAGRARLYAAAAVAGLAPLALGSVVLTRFDLWPAALTIGALAATASGRERLGLGVLAAAVAAKVYPIVLLPILLVHAGRRLGARGSVAGLAVFVLVLAAILVPFAALAPGGLADSLQRQTGRPLQVESLGSALLLAAHQAGSYEPTVVSSFGSQNLAGALPGAVADVQTALQVVALVCVWLLFAAGRGGRAELLAASATAVAVFVALGKVLSPQYLIWLVPLVPLVGGRRGIAASGLLACALVLTQLWFPSRYWHLVAFEAGPTWLLVARDAVLVALAAVCARAIRPGPARPRSG